MGVDFIRKRAPTFNKAWDRRAVELATPSLFAQGSTSAARTALAKVLDQRITDEPGALVVRSESDGLVAYRDLRPVAQFIDPPSDLVKTVKESGGVAGGTVRSSHGMGVVEIDVC